MVHAVLREPGQLQKRQLAQYSVARAAWGRPVSDRERELVLMEGWPVYERAATSGPNLDYQAWLQPPTLRIHLRGCCFCIALFFCKICILHVICLWFYLPRLAVSHTAGSLKGTKHPYFCRISRTSAPSP